MHKANTSSLPQARDNDVPLSRRRVSPGRHLRPGQNKWPDRSQVAPRPRLHPKSGEMQLRTNSSVHAPGSDVEHKDDDAIATSGEGSSDSETSSTCSEESDVSCCSTSLGADELCEYCLTARQAAIATATVVAEAALQRSIGHVQNHAYNGGSTPQSRMVALLQVASQEYSQAFSPRSRNDRCFDEGLRRRMQPASLSRRMAREQGQRHTHKSPRTRDRLEGVQQVRVRDKRESNLVSDRQSNSGSLPNERRRNEMSAAGPASLKDPPEVSQGRGDPDPSIPEGHCEPSSRRPLEESESPGMEPVHLSMPQVVQVDGTTSGRSVCEQSNVQSRQILQHGSDGQAGNRQRWGQGEVATRTPICLPATTHDPTDARAVEANGRRTDTDHSVLARPVLVSRGNTDGRLTPKAIQATQVATNECDNGGGDSESDGIDQIDCVEALYRVCRREGLSNEATRRVLARWRKSTQAGYRPAWNDWCAFRRKEGLPVLQVCVKDLAEFLNHQIMTKNHKSSTLEHAASAICSILEPLAERRASAAPVIKAILMGAFYDNPPSRCTCATWDVKKVLDMLKAWGPPDQLNYTRLTLKTCMILALCTCKRPSDLNLLRISKGNMQVMESAITFHPAFGAKNARRSHAYTPPFTIRLARDECLCPVRTIKAYLKATMSRPNRSKNFFVTRKQGNAIAVTNGTIATWLTETLKLANIKASGGSTRKASASWAASKGVSIKTILEAGDWAHASTAYRHYIKCLPEAVAQRIAEQISGSIQANVVGQLDVEIDPEPD